MDYKLEFSAIRQKPRKQTCDQVVFLAYHKNQPLGKRGPQKFHVVHRKNFQSSSETTQIILFIQHKSPPWKQEQQKLHGETGNIKFAWVTTNKNFQNSSGTK